MREREKGAAAGWSHPSISPPRECCLVSLGIQNTNNFVLRATNSDCFCNTAERAGRGGREKRTCAHDYLSISHVNHQNRRHLLVSLKNL